MAIQIRQFGNKTQVHRNVYIPAEKETVTTLEGQTRTVNKKGTGRTKTKMLFSFDTELLDSLDINGLLSKVLTEPLENPLDAMELDRLEEYRRRYLIKATMDKAKDLPVSVPADIRLLAQELYYLTMTQEQCDDIFNAVDDLKAAIKKVNGLKVRPAKARHKK